MDHRAYLGALDYAVIGITLLIPTIIGLRFRSKKKRDETSKEYLLAGKDMSIFPVIMSITVTMLSGITMLGHPAEIYKYGLQLLLLCVGFPIGTVLSSYIFLPVFFQCDVSTSYEILFMSVVLYAPVLALSAVTDLSLEASIIVFGLVCSFYCAVGGLKAVIWTDVFQACLILSTLIIVYIKGIGEAGGISEIYRKSAESNRLNIFEESLLKRKYYQTKLLSQFWKKWKDNYLLNIRSFHHFPKPSVERNLRVGDVILEGNTKSKFLWNLGRIAKVMQGRDGLVRSCVVKTKTGEFKRPVQLIYLLELSET
ncbi:sodium-coupled monocarboxylate transporter 2 [Trichonephila clavata]|uniref:Sodium-coupled monocarboxylate transporter 2 n=1 Tax=Trichonephila clavata TaxID=2740835 RepID=A0A8X6HFV6_TRICU|nr:sodium-coupled monocarboxylate transporter 2 [Trichonephila clavata]